MSHTLVVPLKNSQERSLQFDVGYLLGGGSLKWSPVIQKTSWRLAIDVRNPVRVLWK